MPLDGRYIAKNSQSIYDVCMNTYGTANLLSKLMKDNSITATSYRPYNGQVFLYDKLLVIDLPVNQLNQVYVTGEDINYRVIAENDNWLITEEGAQIVREEFL